MVGGPEQAETESQLSMHKNQSWKGHGSVCRLENLQSNFTMGVSRESTPVYSPNVYSVRSMQSFLGIIILTQKKMTNTRVCDALSRVIL